MGVEEGQLLVPMDGIVGVVDIENDAFGNTAKAVAEQVDQGVAHAPQRTPRRCVLQPRQGRLAHQIAAALRQPPAGQLEGRVEAQAIEVVTILVAAGNGEHPRPLSSRVRMIDTLGIAPVDETSGEAIGEPEPASISRNRHERRHPTTAARHRNGRRFPSPRRVTGQGRQRLSWFMVSWGFSVAVGSRVSTEIIRNLNSLIHAHHPYP